MSNAQTISSSLAPAAAPPLPTPRPSDKQHSSKLVTPGATTQIPLDTPPASDPSDSPRFSPDGLPLSSSPASSPSVSGLPNGKTSFPFPNGNDAPQPATRNSVDETQRQRYHSTVSKSDIASLAPPGSLNRSKSSRTFGSKLQSLRKKIENELSRKRPGGRSGTQRDQLQEPSSINKRPSKRALKGTVAGLRPSPALTVPEAMSVADASQLCAAKRTDCVLVVDDEEGLSGIFTAKDLAFRVTADGLDPRTTTVAQIMTKNPMVTRDTTSATEALQLMVSRHFRHLPVCNEDGDVVGLLDITKVFHDALAKVERSSSATNQLSAALAGVHNELGSGLVGNPQAAAMMAYVDALRDRMSMPDLLSVLDTSLPPPTVSPRTSVREAARLMKERRTTAVCVLEPSTGSVMSGTSNPTRPPKIAGIFTSKDVVLRVIAAGLDSARCSVVRVMTPHPDTAPPTMIVQDALRKMHQGHYLNLPVVEDDGRLMGIVDVLKLTYATLEQIEQMSDDRGNEGPMWGKFFDSFNSGGADEDSQSALSMNDTPSKSSVGEGHQRQISSITSPISEVMPNDSASAVNEQISELGLKGAGPGSSVAPALSVIDDGTYVFKFKTPSGRTHRFQARHDNYELLRDIVHGKLSTDPFFDTPSSSDAPAPDPTVFTLSYTDDDGDLVEITADSDVSDAVRIARGQQTDRIVLVVNGGKNWEDAMREKIVEEPVEEVKVVEPAPTVVTVEETPTLVNDDVKAAPDPAVVPTYGAKGVVHTKPQQQAPAQEDLIMGVLPKDLALPAAVGFLGVVIAGVFVASRSSK